MKNYPQLVRGLLGGAALFLATTAFECASSEMTTAHLQFNNKEYAKARASLEAEVKKNPKNEEAWLLLARTDYSLKDYRAMNDVAKQVLSFGTKYEKEITALRYDAWAATYSEGARHYNEAEDSNTDKLRQAYNEFQLASELQKDDAEVYTLMASTAQRMGDTMRAVSNYEYYIGLTEANALAGAGMGLAVGSNEQHGMQALGAPMRKRFIVIGNDSALVYVYPRHNGHDISVFFTHEKNKEYTVEGWHVAPPSRAMVDSNRVITVRTVAYRYLGNLSYNKGLNFLKQLENSPKHDSSYYRAAVGEFDRTIAYFSKAQMIDPSDEFVASVLSDAYLRTNKLNVARASYEKIVKEYPRNKSNRMNYGLLLMNTEDYAGAVKQFSEAANIDPKYEAALFNLGAAYKNWAVAEQGKSKDAKAVAEKLEKAQQYFERSYELSPTNVEVLAQLAEIYGVLKKKDKLQSILGSLESTAVRNADDPRVWEALGGVYTRLGNTKKAKELYQKADDLRK